MTWVRLDDEFPDHPKVLGLSDPAFRLHVHALCYASRLLTDGMVPHSWLTGGRGREPKAVEQLVATGLWDKVEGGYQIHDYLVYQQSRAHVQSQRTKAVNRMTLARSSREQDANKAGSSGEVHHSTKNITKNITTQETERNPPAPAPATLVMSPIEYQKALQHNAFVGSRLLVPKKLHGDFRRDLGGDNPEAALMAWYDKVNEEIELTRETIAPDVWKWLTARFKSWASERAFDVEMQRLRGA